jgi:hypothetical protein
MRKLVRRLDKVGCWFSALIGIGDAGRFALWQFVMINTQVTA